MLDEVYLDDDISVACSSADDKDNDGGNKNALKMSQMLDRAAFIADSENMCFVRRDIPLFEENFRCLGEARTLCDNTPACLITRSNRSLFSRDVQPTVDFLLREKCLGGAPMYTVYLSFDVSECLAISGACAVLDVATTPAHALGYFSRQGPSHVGVYFKMDMMGKSREARLNFVYGGASRKTKHRNGGSKLDTWCQNALETDCVHIDSRNHEVFDPHFKIDNIFATDNNACSLHMMFSVALTNESSKTMGQDSVLVDAGCYSVNIFGDERDSKKLIDAQVAQLNIARENSVRGGMRGNMKEVDVNLDHMKHLRMLFGREVHESLNRQGDLDVCIRVEVAQCARVLYSKFFSRNWYKTTDQLRSEAEASAAVLTLSRYKSRLDQSKLDQSADRVIMKHIANVFLYNRWYMCSDETPTKNGQARWAFPCNTMRVDYEVEPHFIEVLNGHYAVELAKVASRYSRESVSHRTYNVVAKMATRMEMSFDLHVGRPLLRVPVDRMLLAISRIEALDNACRECLVEAIDYFNGRKKK